MSLRLSKKGIIPYLPSEAAAQAGLIRDLLSYIKAGDIASRSKNERIGVRYDGTGDESSCRAPFCGQPHLLVAKYNDFISNSG